MIGCGLKCDITLSTSYWSLRWEYGCGNILWSITSAALPQSDIPGTGNLAAYLSLCSISQELCVHSVSRLFCISFILHLVYSASRLFCISFALLYVNVSNTHTHTHTITHTQLNKKQYLFLTHLLSIYLSPIYIFLSLSLSPLYLSLYPLWSNHSLPLTSSFLSLSFPLSLAHISK